MEKNNKNITNKDNSVDIPTELSGANVITYDGLVTVKYKTKSGKTITFKGHNEGLPAMFKYICKALSGKTSDLSSERPVFADIRCVYSDDVDTTTGEVKIKSASCLYNCISISSPEYFYDTSKSRWVSRFNITLSYNMINYDVVDAHPKAVFYLYLLSASNTEFARITLEDSGLLLTQLLPGTQALIEWLMVFQNNTSTT